METKQVSTLQRTSKKQAESFHGPEQRGAHFVSWKHHLDSVWEIR